MSVTIAVARRELASFFRLPLGWIAIALFVFLTGIIFSIDTLRPGQPATMRVFFAFAGWLMLPIVPAVGMRLFSEEFRAGTIEPLLTSPASDLAVVMGKFLGGLAFLLLLASPSLIHAGILRALSDPAPDFGPMLAGYLSLTLTASFYLAIALLCSSLTNNQTLAFLSTFFALLALLMGPGLIESYIPSGGTWEWARAGIGAMAVNRRAVDFAKGVIDTSHLVFFVSATVGLIVLTAAILSSRRWR